MAVYMRGTVETIWDVFQPAIKEIMIQYKLDEPFITYLEFYEAVRGAYTAKEAVDRAENILETKLQEAKSLHIPLKLLAEF